MPGHPVAIFAEYRLRSCAKSGILEGGLNVSAEIAIGSVNMDFSVQFLSFIVIQTEGQDAQSAKNYKHYQTLDRESYYESEIKEFLDGEFARICKRKVEKNPNTENAPTKIGRFIVEPGHELTSNPNYNLLQRLRIAESKEQFHTCSDDLVRAYMETSSVRGGAFVVASAKLNKYFDEPFVFVMKCDFEPKIASISDEHSLIKSVQMAINARNIKSIQYPHMPEEGTLEEWELKIHQASHAKYFEDFLKFIDYEKAIPVIVNEHVMTMVQEYMEDKWQGAQSEEREQEEQSLEFWAASEKRELQEKWTHDTVVEATQRIIEHKPDIEMAFKLDGVAIKGQMAQFGENVFIARLNGRYAAIVVGDSLQFDKGVSPIELLHPEDLEDVVRRIKERDDQAAVNRYESGDDGGTDNSPPW